MSSNQEISNLTTEKDMQNLITLSKTLLNFIKIGGAIGFLYQLTILSFLNKIHYFNRDQVINDTVLIGLIAFATLFLYSHILNECCNLLHQETIKNLTKSHISLPLRATIIIIGFSYYIFQETYLINLLSPLGAAYVLGQIFDQKIIKKTDETLNPLTPMKNPSKNSLFVAFYGNSIHIPYLSLYKSQCIN